MKGSYDALIQELAKDSIKSLEKIYEHGAVSYNFFDINCGDLADYNNIDIRYSVEHKKMFEELNEIKGPVLYYFEIISKTDIKQLIDSITEYSKSQDAKAIPAIKKNIPISNVLYVGKSVNPIWGRMIHHLGFYRVKNTAGLQLFYWAKKIKLDVRVHIYEFERDSSDLLGMFEKRLAQKLNPVIGKHKY